MSSENINMRDPLFLVSRSFDGELSKAEKAELDRMLAGSASLRAEAEQLRTVAWWVKDRGENKVQIDWESQKKLVLAEVADAESDDRGFDAALGRLAARKPDYDGSALVAGIMAQIAPVRARKHNGWGIVARIGVPLAAAAAIVLAVTATMYWPVKPTPMVAAIPRIVVEIGPRGPGNEGKVVTVVMFAKPVERAVVGEDTLTFGYMTLGSSPMAQAEESPL